MNLARLIREVRPTGGVHEASALSEAPERPALVVFHRDDPADLQFQRLAPRLAYGSAVLFLDDIRGASQSVADVAAASDFREWDPPGRPPNTRAWVKVEYGGEGGGYSTHLPHLLEAVRRTNGPVLELGSGDGSTPALHELCAAAGRLLVTVDNNREWLSKFEHLAGELHVLEHLADPAETRWIDDRPWGVVFVDHAPGETRRRAVARAKAARVDYVVVHDTEELSYNVEDLLASWGYRVDFRRRRPWTTVVSDVLPVWEG